MHGMIAALQPQAVEEGAKVLLRGGNAIDAAVTCAFVQGILDPHSCGIGGYALLNLHLANAPSSPSGLLGLAVQNQSVAIDGPALAGSKVTPTMWEDRVLVQILMAGAISSRIRSMTLAILPSVRPAG